MGDGALLTCGLWNDLEDGLAGLQAERGAEFAQFRVDELSHVALSVGRQTVMHGDGRALILDNDAVPRSGRAAKPVDRLSQGRSHCGGEAVKKSVVAPLEAMQPRRVKAGWRQKVVEDCDRTAGDQRQRPAETLSQREQQMSEGRINHHCVWPFGDIDDRPVDIQKKSPLFWARQLVAPAGRDWCMRGAHSKPDPAVSGRLDLALVGAVRPPSSEKHVRITPQSVGRVCRDVENARDHPGARRELRTYINPFGRTYRGTGPNRTRSRHSTPGF